MVANNVNKHLTLPVTFGSVTSGGPKSPKQ